MAKYKLTQTVGDNNTTYDVPFEIPEVAGTYNVKFTMTATDGNSRQVDVGNIVVGSSANIYKFTIETASGPIFEPTLTTPALATSCKVTIPALSSTMSSVTYKYVDINGNSATINAKPSSSTIVLVQKGSVIQTTQVTPKSTLAEPYKYNESSWTIAEDTTLPVLHTQTKGTPTVEIYKTTTSSITVQVGNNLNQSADIVVYCAVGNTDQVNTVSKVGAHATTNTSFNSLTSSNTYSVFAKYNLISGISDYPGVITTTHSVKPVVSYMVTIPKLTKGYSYIRYTVSGFDNNVRLIEASASGIKIIYVPQNGIVWLVNQTLSNTALYKDYSGSVKMWTIKAATTLPVHKAQYKVTPTVLSLSSSGKIVTGVIKNWSGYTLTVSALWEGDDPAEDQVIKQLANNDSLSVYGTMTTTGVEIWTLNAVFFDPDQEVVASEIASLTEELYAS